MIPYKVPSPATLKKYGLTERLWLDMLEEQNYVCAICKHTPSSGRFVVDHLHVQGFKGMKPEKKRLWLRGLLCVHCNRYYVAKGITVQKAMAVVDYLSAFELRRPR